LAATVVNWDTTTVILQLYDNSVYMVGGQEGEKTVPKRGQDGVFHIDGHLVVANKDTVKSLTSLLMPLLRILGNSRKLFLTPLARYWIGPCCDAETHHTNYRAQGYLPRLGDAIHALHVNNIRDGLFARRVPNFRVLCPNRMIGVGQRRTEPSDEEAALSAALWGTDPVHPSTAAYRQMAEHIEADLANSEARYTNPVKKVPSDKRQRVDLSLQRADWVSGCSAAASRRENPIISSGPCPAVATPTVAPTTEAIREAGAIPPIHVDALAPAVPAPAPAPPADPTLPRVCVAITRATPDTCTGVEGDGAASKRP
jgi:hypothetical protein